MQAMIAAPNVTTAANIADTRVLLFSRPSITHPSFIRIEIAEAG
jgi:hypothetical protein